MPSPKNKGPNVSPRATPAAVMDHFNSPAFSSHVESLISEWHVPGLAIAVVDDKTIHSLGFGNASVEPLQPCTPDTLFDIASSSKSMTAAAVGILVEDNDKHPEVRWHTPMSSLLPEDFVMSKEEHTKEVTIEDILSHRTGLPTHDASYMGVTAEQPDTAQSVTRNLRNLEITAPLRSRHQYCNLMFTVATYLIEKLTGSSFEDFLHERFFKPLGMTSTNLQPDGARKAGLGDRLAKPYDWQESTSSYKELPYEQTPEAQGAGSIFTSVNDYAKYVRAIMNKQAPISKFVHEGVTKMRSFPNPKANPGGVLPFESAIMYAAGWEIYWHRGYKVIAHDGMVSGFSSTHFFLPQLKFGGVVFGNAENGGSVGGILMRGLIEEVLGVRDEERVDWSKEQQRLESGWKDRGKESERRLRKELCPSGTCEEQKTPLEEYVGDYWNEGYHGMKVEIKDDKLFIDATDRSANGFTLSFEHGRGQTEYLVRFGEGSTETIKGEFRFEDGRVVSLGLHLEPDLKDLIWFDRIVKGEKQELRR